MVIFGRKPVLEALKSGQNLQKIYLQLNQSGHIVGEILRAAREHRVIVSEVSFDKLSSIAKSDDHQGVAALQAESTVIQIDELLENAKETAYPLLVILENIQDPHNLGAIIRSAEAAGANGVIITKHNSAPLNESAVKSSAGAAAHIPITLVHNLAQTLQILKDTGYWIVGSTLNNADDYREPDYLCPIALIIGNEENGLRQLTMKKCDFLVKIPMLGKINSLNASVAAGVLLFEIISSREPLK